LKTVIDLNRARYSIEPFHLALDALLENSAPPRQPRPYLGASNIGSECLRKVQYDWMIDPQFPLRTADIFERGHFFETRMREHFKAAGFKFAPAEQLAFSAVDGLFQGHADGILVDGPQISGLFYPAIWEHKALNDNGWKTIERDGLAKHYAVYAAQVAVYQAYLDTTNPAVFNVTNANTCERLHFLVPYDAQLAQLTSDRAVTVIKATQAGELLDRFTSNPMNFRCRMCKHNDRCWGPAL
jgi:hypothetical protein